MPTRNRPFYRDIPPGALMALTRVALSEFRTPDQQIAKYITEGLIRDGHIPEDDPSPAELSPAYPERN